MILTHKNTWIPVSNLGKHVKPYLLLARTRASMTLTHKNTWNHDYDSHKLTKIRWTLSLTYKSTCNRASDPRKQCIWLPLTNTRGTMPLTYKNTYIHASETKTHATVPLIDENTWNPVPSLQKTRPRPWLAKYVHRWLWHKHVEPCLLLTMYYSSTHPWLWLTTTRGISYNIY